MAPGPSTAADGAYTPASTRAAPESDDEDDADQFATLRDSALLQQELGRRDRLWRANAAPLRVVSLLVLGLHRIRVALAERVAAWKQLGLHAVAGEVRDQAQVPQR